jgi:hypothetical protein
MIAVYAAALGGFALVCLARALKINRYLLRAVSNVASSVTLAILGLYLIPMFLIVAPPIILLRLISGTRLTGPLVVLAVAYTVQLLLPELQTFLELEIAHGHHAWLAICAVVLPASYQTLVSSLS